MNSWAQGQGFPGMGYIIFNDGDCKGPVANALGTDKSLELKNKFNLKMVTLVFFLC